VFSAVLFQATIVQKPETPEGDGNEYSGLLRSGMPRYHVQKPETPEGDGNCPSASMISARLVPSFRNLKPRKGTETLASRLYSQYIPVQKPETPEGDGNRILKASSSGGS